jgi:methoxymalonate biosynthesis acyl carrier protein
MQECLDAKPGKAFILISDETERKEQVFMEAIKARIRGFISDYIRNHAPTDDEDIFASGFVNSLFAMQLVTFVESEFRITIDSEDLDIENFNTINAICSLVERKTGSFAQI